MDAELMVDEEMEPDPHLNAITNQFLGAAFEVHTELWPGYQESLYANALAIEMTRRGIRFEPEKHFDVFYKGQPIGRGRADFIVEGAILIELKAVEALTPVFTSRVISYLKATKLKLALILNFNVRRLKDGIKRIAR